MVQGVATRKALGKRDKAFECNIGSYHHLVGAIGAFDTTAIMPMETKGTTMSLKALNSVTDTLVAASGTIDKRIAAHLVEIAKHINGAGNGDVSAANYLFSKITNLSGIRKQAIGNWLLEFAGCSWNAQKKQFGRKKEFHFDLQLAVENPWYKFTAQPEFKPVDSLALIKAAVGKMKKAIEDTEHTDHQVNKEHLRSLTALRAGERVTVGSADQLMAPAETETVTTEVKA